MPVRFSSNNLIFSGTIEVNGNISYASQDPWIFPATVKQNILFGEVFDKTRYDEVVRVCALEYDFDLLEQGDQTILSDRGQNLSKGQQARINLARAIYRDTNIYLLDDCLTALDARVQDFIFKECVLKLLKNKVIVLVSQNALHVEKADQVIILNEGIMHIQDFETDSLEAVIPATNDITLETKTGIIQKDKNPLEQKNSCNEKLRLSSAEQRQKRESIYREVKKQGKVELEVYRKFFNYGGGCIIFVSIIMVYVAAQFCDSYGDKLLTNW